MRTTRRHLLSLFGLGAAAAALAPSAGQAAERPTIRYATLQMPLPSDLSGVHFENCTFVGGVQTTETLTVSGNATFGTLRMDNSAPLLVRNNVGVTPTWQLDGWITKAGD